MGEKTFAIYSADGLVKKIEKMKLSKREAIQLKKIIFELETVPIVMLTKRGKVNKGIDTENIYICKVNKRLRLMISPIEKNGKSGVIIYDIVDVNDKKYCKKGSEGVRPH